MGSILLPKRLHPDFSIPGRKPICPIEIDWSEPLSKDLVFAVFTAQHGQDLYPRDLVSGKIPTDIDSNTRKIGVEKNRYLSTDSAGSGVTYGRTGLDELTSTTGMTVITRFRSFVGARSIAILDTGENSNGYGFMLIYDDVSRITNGFRTECNNGLGTASAWDVLGTNSEDRFHTIAFRHVTSGLADLFLSGLPVSNADFGMVVTGHANRVTKLFARRNNNNSTDLAIDWVLAFRGALSNSAIKILSDNPAIVLKPSSQIFFFAPDLSRDAVTAKYMAGGVVFGE